MASNALLYVRVSSADQEKEGYSLDAQKRLGHEYVLRKDLQIVLRCNLQARAGRPPQKIHRRYNGLPNDQILSGIIESPPLYRYNPKAKGFSKAFKQTGMTSMESRLDLIIPMRVLVRIGLKKEKAREISRTLSAILIVDSPESVWRIWPDE